MGGCVGDEYINGRAIALGHSITLRITAASQDINDYFFFYFDRNITEEKKKKLRGSPRQWSFHNPNAL